MTLYLTIPDDQRCRFGCSLDANPPVAIVELSAGCIAFPDDREQLLCLHHVMRAEPRGTLVVTAWDPAVTALLTERGLL